MRAMVLEAPGTPLVLRERPAPTPAANEVLVRVEACGVCRTDLHVVDGDLPFPGRDVIPGHEIVGRVVTCGGGVDGMVPGRRVGIPWLGWTCGSCRYCQSGAENLCDRAGFTGYTRQGGYADLAREFGLTTAQVTSYLAQVRRSFRTHALESLRVLSGSDAHFRDEARELFGVDA